MRSVCIFMVVISTGISGIRAQTLDEKLNAIYSARKLMGLSLLAVCHDSVIYSGNFGIADYARNIPVTDSTMFRIASISKTVTATALMILYEKKLFGLDDDISTALGYKVRNPDFPGVPVTYRMLLSHTSSLQDGTGYWNFLMSTYKNNPPPKIISLLSDTGSYHTADIWQNNKPGTYFMYCNMNFGIIATLIEKISGIRFDIFCKQNIFDPLGMKSFFNVQNASNINNVAVLYRMSSGVWQPQADNFKGVMPAPRDLSTYTVGDNGSIFGPQAALRISAKDLSKFMMMHMNGGIYKGVRILQDSTVHLMHSPQWAYNGSNGDTYYNLFKEWGLGFQLITNTENGDIVFSDREMKGHTGDAYGLLSDMYFDEESKSGIIFITNGSAESFDYGTATAFYAVEEDVYSTLNDFSVQPCINNKDFMNVSGSVETPDAADSVMHVRFYLPDAGRVQYLIYNYLGQQERSQQIFFDAYGRKQVNIDVSGLLPGIYYCIIRVEGNRNTFYFSVPGKD